MTSKVWSFLVVAAIAGPAAADNANPLAAPPPASPPPTSYGAPVPAPPPQEGGQKANGVVAEIHIGSQMIAIGNVGLNVVSLSGVEGGLFGGYKVDRIIFGVGLSLARVETGQSFGMGMAASQAQTPVLLLPGIRFALVRSADQRVELFGQADFGFGHVFYEATGGGPSPSNFQFRYQFGPGLRYWIHPQLSFSAVGGLRGDYGWVSTANNSTNTNVTSIFGTLQFVGVY